MPFPRFPRLRTLVLALACAAALLAPSAAADNPEAFPVQLVRVNVPSQADRDRLTNLRLDLTEHGGDG
jgi:hypothetical protein